MGIVAADISMSLDGFIAGPNDTVEQGLGEGGERLHEWVVGLEAWRSRHGLSDGDLDDPANELMDESFERNGAIIIGRRMFDLAEEAWGDEPPFHDEYMTLAPDPDAFPALVEKVKGYDRAVEGFPADAIRNIQAPTMIVIGDSDIVQPEHAVEMFRLLGGGVIGDIAGLPNSRLAILPGTTHITVMHRAEWLVPMIEEFLAAPMPEA